MRTKNSTSTHQHHGNENHERNAITTDTVAEERMIALIERYESKLNARDEIKNEPSSPLSPILYNFADEGDFIGFLEICISMSYIAASQPKVALIIYILGGFVVNSFHNYFMFDVVSLGLDRLQLVLFNRENEKLKNKVHQTLLRVIWVIFIATQIDSSLLEEIVNKIKERLVKKINGEI